MATEIAYKDVFIKRYPHEDDAEHERKCVGEEVLLANGGWGYFASMEFQTGTMLSCQKSVTVPDPDPEQAGG